MIVLSKQIRNNLPIYGGVFNKNLTKSKSISVGDSCNESSLFFGFHVGTHVDFPWHFINDGKKGCDYNYFIIYKNPTIVSTKIVDSLMQIENTLNFDPDSECIMIVAKEEENNSNILLNVGLSLEFAKVIYDKLPKLRAVFLNTVSISSINNRSVGREVHKFFLKKGILIYEDCDFSKAAMINYNNYIYTFHIFGLENDGSPCVIFSN